MTYLIIYDAQKHMEKGGIKEGQKRLSGHNLTTDPTKLKYMEKRVCCYTQAIEKAGPKIFHVAGPSIKCVTFDRSPSQLQMGSIAFALT